jgi:hypothetical protein
LAALLTLATFSYAQSSAPQASTPSNSDPNANASSQAPSSAPADPNRPSFGKPNDSAPANAPATNAPAKTSASDTSTAPSNSNRPSFGKPNDDTPASPNASASSGDTPSSTPPPAKDSAKSTTPKTDALPSPGEALDPHIKKGSEDDVDAVGTRNIGGRGMSNWYSTNWEIGTGKEYSMEIEKSAHLVTDPVVVEYVNRVGQNIVKNSDCKVPFTIKVIDSDEINAMALPGGFFYVNSGLILAADEESELAGVMAHETAHVCAHHAAREQTKMNYAQIGMIPVMVMLGGTWTGYGIYEASQLAIPLGLLEFSREYEAEADWLGVQYMYKAGYDPQAFIEFFEKIDALEKHKPGTLAKVFADHPQTPDRIMHSEEEIATILPARPDYVVTTSEFDDVKSRLARIENKRKLNDKGKGNTPTLRRVGANDPNSPTGSSTSDDRPTLGQRN